jgi:hypothetical protein
MVMYLGLRFIGGVYGVDLLLGRRWLEKSGADGTESGQTK